tara:strand:+ start:5901 stop:7688 length:1788 start_codon:yes stop_codon:yes gene_type:complete
MSTKLPNLDLKSLREAYAGGDWTPTKLVQALDEAITKAEPTRIWIHRLSLDELLEYAKQIESLDPASLPLFGVPFAIKDNIDLKGAPTTAACPEFAYDPERSAFVVQTLIDAGAIPIGKTNLDQFATGLVGVRSPYGFPENAFDPEYIPGGSSSGSAIAVAQEFASFSLGTDTAGSGRIPAAFNELVGHKPSRGLLSCSGVFPACKTLDCVSIFANNSGDAEAILDVAAVFDPSDAYAREDPTSPEAAPLGQHFRFGVPNADQLEFFGNDSARALFAEKIKQLQEAGGELVSIDFSPFLEAARLLYEGPWVAERYAAMEEVFKTRPEILHPVTRTIVEGGAKPLAVDAFNAEYRLRALKRRADEAWKLVDVILTPTAGTIYKAAEVEAEPIQLNSNLGYYTNFMNLLDYSATAFPAGKLDSGLPFGVTFFAPAFHDRKLLELADRFDSATPPSLSGTETGTSVPEGWSPLVVCGAHMRGLPLNHQLTERQGRFLGTAETAPCYDLYALPEMDNLPPRPGLVRNEDAGKSIEVEVWALPLREFGEFVTQIPEPLGIGKIRMASGEVIPGFLCENFILQRAKRITEVKNWRNFVRNG